MKVTINNKVIDLSTAIVSVQDLNDSNDEFNASAVQVDVDVGKFGFCYQTSKSFFGNGVSSHIEINEESGSYATVLELLTEHDALEYDNGEYTLDQEEEQVYEAGVIIGEALNVQQLYDDYMSKLGAWESADGMDANNERFVTHS